MEGTQCSAGPLLAPARERNSSWSVMCRPTATELSI